MCLCLGQGSPKALKMLVGVLLALLKLLSAHDLGVANAAAIQSQPRLASMPIVFGAGLDFLDITDYIFLDDEAASEDGGAFGPLPEGLGPDCTGIVLHSSSPSLNPSASPQVRTAFFYLLLSS